MQNCTVCGFKRWYGKIDNKTGLQLKDREGKLLWRCGRCGNVQTEPTLAFVPNILRRDPNILYLDIETSKSLYFNYGRKVNSKYLRPSDMVKEYYIISWAASYLHMDKVWGDCVSVKEARDWTDENILQGIHDLMQSADIIAGHNVDSFDLKRLNTRFERAGIEPVVGKKTIDTLKVARARLALEDNSLDGVCRHYGLKQKDDITDADWLQIVTSPNKAVLDKVFQYNIHDVTNGKAALNKMIRIANKPDYYGTKNFKAPDLIPYKKVVK